MIKKHLKAFLLGPLFTEKTESKKPFTKIKSFVIKKMGWCDDIKDKKNYNKLINIKKNTS